MSSILVIKVEEGQSQQHPLQLVDFTSLISTDMCVLVEKKHFYVAKNRWGSDKLTIPIGLLPLFVNDPKKYGEML